MVKTTFYSPIQNVDCRFSKRLWMKPPRYLVKQNKTSIYRIILIKKQKTTEVRFQFAWGSRIFEGYKNMKTHRPQKHVALRLPDALFSITAGQTRQKGWDFLSWVRHSSLIHTTQFSILPQLRTKVWMEPDQSCDDLFTVNGFKSIQAGDDANSRVSKIKMMILDLIHKIATVLKGG